MSGGLGDDPVLGVRQPLQRRAAGRVGARLTGVVSATVEDRERTHPALGERELVALRIA